MKQINGTMLQYFEWNMDVPGGLWNKIKSESEDIARLGITSAWLPPAYKGIGGKNDVGYGVYDVYDLGEFDQKGSIPTKYGTRGEYIRAIESLKQDILANKCDWADHTQEGEIEKIKASTKFTFPGRRKKIF